MNKRYILIGLIMIGLISFLSFRSYPLLGKEADQAIIRHQEYYEESYLSYLKENGYDKNDSVSLKEVEVPITEYTASDMNAVEETGGIYTEDMGSITWNFNIPNTGFYNIEVDYLPIRGTNTEIQRQILIDGNSYFKGMDQIIFQRSFEHMGESGIKDNDGYEIKPIAVEAFNWQKDYIKDSSRRMLRPYLFYLEKGKHSITFVSIKEPMKVGKITLKGVEEVQSYTEYFDKFNKEQKIYPGQNIICEAERTDENVKDIYKSNTTIAVNKVHNDYTVSPYHPYKIKYNTIGGANWNHPGDKVEWKIEVPKDGLYKISFKGRQHINRGVSSYRLLRVNGELPFEEAQYIKFSFSPTFKYYTLGDDNGDYLFNLKEGTNTISLETVLGDFAEPLTEIEGSLLQLNTIYRKIVQITGVVPDKFTDYELEKKIPGLRETITTERDRLFSVVDKLVEITGEKGERTILVEKVARQLEKISNNMDNITKQVGQLKNNISSLGTWVMDVPQMPVELDKIILSGSQKVEEDKGNFIIRAYYNTVRFLSTFFVDETKLGTDSYKDGITVWISGGRDQAQILKGMINEYFTPQTQIPVNLVLIPAPTLIIPATLAGKGPDVALGLEQKLVIDLSIRNAITDMKQFDDFGEVKQRFFESAINTVKFQNKVYALPEQQQFPMMFYRKDIFDELGIEYPKTWEDVENVLAELSMKNYDFYIPNMKVNPGLFISMLYQNNLDLYEGEGEDYGIRSALDNPKSLDIFKDYADRFTIYKIPVDINFANRFRTGETPIGIENYMTYNQLEIFAPEIKGLWGFVPLPGVMNGDVLNNSTMSTTINSVIMNDSKYKDESWEFIKWWLSKDAQIMYGNVLEATIGNGARYATANPEVLKSLPWAPKDAKLILEQFDQTIGIPEVPGSYMTTRMLQYAYATSITDGLNPREVLYTKTKEINKEIDKKRKEFKLSTIDKE